MTDEIKPTSPSTGSLTPDRQQKQHQQNDDDQKPEKHEQATTDKRPKKGLFDEFV